MKRSRRLEQKSYLRNIAGLVYLSMLALLILGYHPGLEDDSFYLAAIKYDLNPSLFPHDAEFFRIQFQATIFDKLIAASVRLSHMPLDWVVLLWHVAAIFLIITGCWRISRRCFVRPEAQWGATTLLALLLTLPLPGIGIAICDQYLHPRTLATAAILAAIVAVLDRKKWLAGFLLLMAVSVHALMACFGISFCVFLWWSLRQERVPAAQAIAALFPLGWIFEPGSDAWRQAASTRGFYFLGSWRWYEWLGVFAPVLMLFVIRRVLTRQIDSRLSALLSATIAYGIFQTAVGIFVMVPKSFERLRPFEPMRYLQILYVVFFLIVGGLLGEFLLKRRTYRWLLLFVPLAAGMLYAQLTMYPASAHLERPGVASRNAWLEAFQWVRQNTPTGAMFAVNPHYEALPGEDYHGFRALAERSVLADYEKDGGMAARVPSLAPRWLREVKALDGWQSFGMADMLRLQRDFGVNWVVLSRSDGLFSGELTCPYANQTVKVCRLY